jgi:hypothetical protein
MAADTQDFLAQTKVHHISKPFDIKKLKKEINRLLAQGR